MWKAIQHRKIAQVLGQQDPTPPVEAFKAVTLGSEDFLTAAVFARLAYLPGNLALSLMRDAAEATSPHPWPEPEPLEASRPWPAIGHDQAVEPDWVLETARVVYVVEAKWGADVVPGLAQLQGQVSAARHRYPDRTRIHIAVVQSGTVVFPPDVLGFVVTWRRLREEVTRGLRTQNDLPFSTRQVLADLQSVLDYRGLSTQYLESLPEISIEAPVPWAPPRSVSARRPTGGLESLPDWSIDPEVLSSWK